MRKSGDTRDYVPANFFGFSAKFQAENAILGDHDHLDEDDHLGDHPT